MILHPHETLQTTNSDSSINQLGLEEFLQSITKSEHNEPKTGRPLNSSLSIGAYKDSHLCRRFGIDDLIRGKRDIEEHEDDLFAIERHIESYDDGYVGKCETTLYLITKETLLPHLQELARTKRADNINVHAVQIRDVGTYDHTYGPDDDYSFIIGLVKLFGTIKLSNGVLDISDLTFKATQERKRVHQYSPIDKRETSPLVKEMVEQLKESNKTPQPTNSIAERLTKTKTEYSSSQWEGGYNGLYDSVKSYGDLKRLILSDDVNTKIFTMTNMIAPLTDLLSETETEELSGILREQLTDDRLCQIPGGSTSYADDEDISSVSNSARYALSTLTGLEYSVRIGRSNHEEVIARVGKVSDVETPSQNIWKIEDILQEATKTNDYEMNKTSTGPNHVEGYGGEHTTTYEISANGKTTMIIKITHPYTTTSDDSMDYACPPEVHVKAMSHMVTTDVLYKKAIGLFDQLKEK
jgi:hypothetical protein